jgi:4-amino-4-deoxy-L-arabinose transferase-like glycosyltransferase
MSILPSFPRRRESSDVTALDFRLRGNEGVSIWLALLALAIAIYVFGLGGQYIPSNGDEMVYVHIARMTAETGHWLPLASALEGTRNTKPPLLIWQAMLAGDWGQHWHMWFLRTPSLLYTLAMAAAICWTTRLITRSTRDGLIAACVYLAFLSTFRYSRPYLTSAPETFWLSLPMFGLLWQWPQTATSNSTLLNTPTQPPGWAMHALLGLGLGLGLAYKSFALIVPAAAAWWLAMVLSAPSLKLRAVLSITGRVSFSAALALGVFALWFVLDPDPAAVWQEFVVAENAGKFSDQHSYWREALLGGGSSIWAQLFAYAVNAGLLAFVVIGLVWMGLKKMLIRGWHTSLTPHMAILLAWVGVWLVVFTLPSQRSARYVIPAMPAVAILIALNWHRLARRWFLPTLLLAACIGLMLGRIAWVGHDLGLLNTAEFGAVLLALGLGATTLIACMTKPYRSRTGAVLASLLVYATFYLTVAPLDGPLGHYAAEVSASMPPQARIAVPNSFNGQFERFRFLLPGHHVFAPYDTEARAAARVVPGSTPMSLAAQLDGLLSQHDAVVWIQAEPTEINPPCAPDCRVLGQRWLLKSRYLSGEVRLDNLWQPQDWLFKREWLLARAAPG